MNAMGVYPTPLIRVEGEVEEWTQSWRAMAISNRLEFSACLLVVEQQSIIYWPHYKYRGCLGYGTEHCTMCIFVRPA